MADLETIQYRARKVAEDISLALQGSLLVRHGHPAVAEAFLATRLGGAVGRRVRNPAHRAGSRADPGTCDGQGVRTRRDDHAIRPVDFDNLKTMTYEVTDRVARITFNRPEKGNAIVADTPLELSALVERADLDPNVHVILVSGRGEGFCAGFDLSAYAEGSSSAGGGSPYADTVLSGKTQADQPSAGSAVGSDDRLPDDEPVRPRLLQPVACRQADGGQDPRLLRGRRHRHRAARRSGDRRGRRQDRLSAHPGVGRARRGHVGASARRSARQTPSADR